MLAKRLGAIALAVALVVAAIVLRRAFDDDGAGSGASTTDAPGQTTVVCASELASACEALGDADSSLAVTVEPAGTTYERIADDPAAAPDAWITLHPWPAMVSRAAAVAGDDDPFAAGTTSVATSDLVMVGRTERLTPLTAHCGGTLSWRCVGDAAGQPWTSLGGKPAWRDLKPSHADAAESAAGLLTFSTVVSDYWGSTDYTGTDLEADDAFQSWISRFEAAIPSYGAGGTPLELLLARPALDVVGTTAAEIDEKAGTQAPTLTSSPPNVRPAPKAEAVVAGDAAARLAADPALRAALEATGWQAAGPGPPAGTGLPPADVMIALRELWQEVARR